MRKHSSFRNAIVAAFPELERNPQALAVFVDQGRIAARAGPVAGGKATGFEWRYTLTAILIDFTGDPNQLAARVLDWIRIHQVDRLQNHGTGDEAFGFKVDILDDRKVDIEISIELDEAVDIAADGTMTYRDELSLDDSFAGVPAETTLDAITIGGSTLLGPNSP